MEYVPNIYSEFLLFIKLVAKKCNAIGKEFGLMCLKHCPVCYVIVSQSQT